MRKIFIFLAGLLLPAAAFGQLRLETGSTRLEWKQGKSGYVLDRLSVEGVRMNVPESGHIVLYSAEKPSAETLAHGFPEPQYRYPTRTWQENNTAVALNRAGKVLSYFPAAATMTDKGLHFGYEDEMMSVEEDWSADGFSDIRVEIRLRAKKDGWWSVASPSLAIIDKNKFRWAAVPGICQGNYINDDFIRALGYGHGIPAEPVVMRERTASTLAPMITDSRGITVSAIAEPGTARDPYGKDAKTQTEWKLGLSLMNRNGEFTPTLYHPVLGEEGSYLKAGESTVFSFRYSIRKTGWYEMTKHVIYDVYGFRKGLALRRNARSLSDRLYAMYDYVTDDSTSMWRNCEYEGLTIGAQDYLGGVYGSEKDAVKNSDYGAMWMLASMTGDKALTEKRLPYALNFKLKQQHLEEGFFKGSCAGQYYLYKSGRFTEEWGPYSEPIGTVYYALLDMGNILLFEPGREDLKQNFHLAAEWLYGTMKDDGSWEVAYDNATKQPLFGDLQDLRPTFYGMLVAYDILKDSKYLKAACKGADWFIANALKRGRFIGVCGDMRFAPDFATAQAAQALYDLYEASGKKQYLDAAMRTAEIYTASIYTHPVPTEEPKTVKGRTRRDWEISQAGLGFEHGGTLGSANSHGPILLASHAGMFVRIFAHSGDSLFLDMARAAAIGRDAFVDSRTGVASYYWDAMDRGAGPYPHHAWWQIGWITDYLIAEAEMRSGGRISFPSGFITPKVGPHKTYGFSPGKIYGESARLVMERGLVSVDNPSVEYLTARGKDCLFVILLNNSGRPMSADITVAGNDRDSVELDSFGISLLKINDLK